MHRLTAATLLGVLLALAPGQCSAQPAAPGGNSPAVRTVVFIAEVLSAQAQPLARKVSLTFTAFGADGKAANVIDPQSGTIHPGPLVLIRTTPWRHESRLIPPVIAVSLTVVYLGLVGEIVQCYATVDGAEVSRSVVQIKAVGPGGSRGGGSAHCEYIAG
jgi:hypothetical protein